MFKNKKGFTLIELIVIIAVLAIIITICVPKFLGQTKEASLTKLKHDAHIVQDASDRYYVDHNDWPYLLDENGNKIIIDDPERVEIIYKVQDYDESNLGADPNQNIVLYEIDFDKLKPYIRRLDSNPLYFVAARGNPDFGITVLDPHDPLTKERINIKPKTIEEHVATSLRFNGINQYAVIPHSTHIDFEYNEDFTVEAWIYVDKIQNYTQNPDNDIIEKWVDKGTIGYPYVIRYIRDTGKIRFGRYNTEIFGVSTNVNSKVSVNDDNWHHIAAVKRGPKLELYIDGILQEIGDDLDQPSTSNTSPLYLGRRGGQSPNYFTGNITDLRIWNIARTPEEIKNNMLTEFTGNEPNLVGYWRLNEGSGNIIYDKSINKNHGTVYCLWQNN